MIGLCWTDQGGRASILGCDSLAKAEGGMSERLPYEIREAMIQTCGRAFWYEDPGDERREISIRFGTKGSWPENGELNRPTAIAHRETVESTRSLA